MIKNDKKNYFCISREQEDLTKMYKSIVKKNDK